MKINYPPNYKDLPLVEATAIGGQTLVGSSGPFPRQHGNCFSIKAGDKYYDILNFKLENLEELLRVELVSWPITILPLSDYHAVICDPRIPEDFYQKRFCRICTPWDLFPLDQQLEIIRNDERQGNVYTSFKCGDGTSWMVGPNKTKIILPQISYEEAKKRKANKLDKDWLPEEPYDRS